MQELDQRDRELLGALQGEIPFVSTPYAFIGQEKSDHWARRFEANKKELYIEFREANGREPTDSEVDAMMERSLFYVCPSRNEGFGLSALEAKAAGKAVAGFEVGVCPGYCCWNSDTVNTSAGYSSTLFAPGLELYRRI